MKSQDCPAEFANILRFRRPGKPTTYYSELMFATGTEDKRTCFTLLSESTFKKRSNQKCSGCKTGISKKFNTGIPQLTRSTLSKTFPCIPPRIPSHPDTSRTAVYSPTCNSIAASLQVSIGFLRSMSAVGPKEDRQFEHTCDRDFRD